MRYDSRCMRCVKIKHVIALRRKTLANGSSPQEEESAKAIADKLVAQYKLTRGECFDREFRTVETEKIIQEVRVHTRERRRRRNREEISI